MGSTEFSERGSGICDRTCGADGKHPRTGREPAEGAVSGKVTKEEL